MTEAFETALRDLLISEGRTDRVAEILQQRLLNSPLNHQERRSFMNFLIQAGHYRKALEVYAHWFREKISSPLYSFCYLLHSSKFQPRPEFFKALFAAVKHADEEDRPTHFLPWETLDARFSELKGKTLDKWKTKARELKQRLYEKLEYVRANRMIEQEEKLLDELAQKYPDDENIQIEKENFAQRWARAVIAKKTSEGLFHQDEQVEAPHTEQETAVAQAITGAMKDLASLKPKMAYDFAIGLYFLEFYEKSREVLHYSVPAAHVDWFEIELLLKSRRFVECLDTISIVEKRYADDPETTFGATYYRALTLAGLGQTVKAAELLRSIVSIRPHYRSAHSLLLKWRG